MSTQAVNTKSATRRELSIPDLDALDAELNSIEQAHAVGILRSTGNWTPAQVLDHLAIFWEYCHEGFPPELHIAPPMRFVLRILLKRKAVSGKPMPAGTKLPGKMMPALAPREGVALDDSLARLRRCVERTAVGEPFVEIEPLIGRLERDEWINVNLGHCALHLSFLFPY